MKHIYEGKTKSVFKNDDGSVTLIFKDDVTCQNGVFDPGANSTGIKIDGVGIAGLKMSEYFFKLLNKKGIPTHFISADITNRSMVVKPITIFGNGVEIICRRKATGSFIKRYGDYAKEGADLNYFVEATLKDDKREDPLISKCGLATLNILTENEYDELEALTKKITKIVSDELKTKGLDLYDVKFEFGKTDNGIILIDEISGGNMRVYNGNQILTPLELSKIVVG